MILARITFHAKFGKAGQVVEMLKQDHSSGSNERRMRLMTDHGGRFDTVILEFEAESMAAHEQGRAKMLADPHFQEHGAQMNDLIDWGGIEFFSIVE